MSTQLSALKQLATTSYQQVISKYPEIASFHASPLTLDSVHTTVKNNLVSENAVGQSKEVSSLTQEEKTTIFDKIAALCEQPQAVATREEQLYLDQQLSDLYGVPVSSTNTEHSLPIRAGRILAQSHQKRTVADDLEHHAQDRHALLSPHRSFYGWLDTTAITKKSSLIEQFSIGLPLFILESWHTDPIATARWYKHKPVLLINPTLRLACIAVIGDIGPMHQQRYQLTGSPELLQAGKFWHPGCDGKAAIFFITAPLSSLTLGILREQ